MKALVVGAGRMGTFHRRVLRDLGYDVTTVDPAPGRADHRTIPLRGNFAVVCVAVPIPALADEAARWVGYEGHLLIEKPMAANAAEGVDLGALFEGQRVGVGYVERFNPQVRRLACELAELPPPTLARFVRASDRPSSDVILDLRSHDVDLARFLNLWCSTWFQCAADEPEKLRTIEVQAGTRTVTANLLDHDTSPLHAQWHAFLTGRSDYATPADAVATLRALELSAVAAA